MRICYVNVTFRRQNVKIRQKSRYFVTRSTEAVKRRRTEKYDVRHHRAKHRKCWTELRCFSKTMGDNSSSRRGALENYDCSAKADGVRGRSCDANIGQTSGECWVSSARSTAAVAAAAADCYYSAVERRCLMYFRCIHGDRDSRHKSPAKQINKLCFI